MSNIISLERVRDLLSDGTFLESEITDLAASANADSDEGAEWLPYYKLSLALLMEAFGEAATIADTLLDFGSFASRLQERSREALKVAIKKAKLSCRPCGIGPDVTPERAAEVNAKLGGSRFSVS